MKSHLFLAWNSSAIRLLYKVQPNGKNSVHFNIILTRPTQKIFQKRYSIPALNFPLITTMTKVVFTQAVFELYNDKQRDNKNDTL